MKNPKVSIIIPTYNYEKFLKENIESILMQDFKDFELIIADDASIDNTATIGQSYEDQDDRINFFKHNKNLGMVENWNWCIEKSAGKYIKPILGDDRFHGDFALGKMVSAMEEDEKVSLVASARQLIDERAKPIGVFRHFVINRHRSGHQSGLDESTRRNSAAILSRVVARCFWFSQKLMKNV